MAIGRHMECLSIAQVVEQGWRNDMEVIDIRFGQGCKGCEYADKCPNAFTEISHHCGAYVKGE